jgi:hypothetical protein
MNALSRIPFWAWYLFSVAFCYWLWNPYFSVTQMMMSDIDGAFKTLIMIVTLIIASLYIVEGHRSLNTFAVILFFALFGAIFWVAAKSGVHEWGTITWWGQWIVGLLLTIAAQGSRLYRNLFGVVTVSDSDAVDHHH